MEQCNTGIWIYQVLDSHIAIRTRVKHDAIFPCTRLNYNDSHTRLLSGENLHFVSVETVVSQTYPLTSNFIAEGNSQTAGDIFLLTFNDLINNFDSTNRPKVISISYGSDESEFTSSQAQSMCNAAQKLTSLGTTIVVSSGDNGVGGQDGDTCREYGSSRSPLKSTAADELSFMQLLSSPLTPAAALTFLALVPLKPSHPR